MKPIPLFISRRMAQMLWTNAMRNFWADQPDRFAPMEGWDGRLPNDPVFDGGTMFWCATGADAVLLTMYEQACDYDVCVLGDEASGPNMDPFVVLSSRDFERGQGHDRQGA